jgi:ATP-binding protein involved in chromosome partitioning
LRTGILDADLYGPSIPKLLGLEGKPAVRDDGIFAPHEAYGLRAMSIGSMLTANQAVVWRGPMATSALRQLLRESDWGSLDVLVVDLPPGTGDVQLTLVQKLKLDGAVIVSTPQEVALIDARRAAAMFGKTATPILGVIENMAWFADPATGAKLPIFGTGGAAREAERLGVPLLAEVPLEMALREGGDEGRPLVVTTPDAPSAKALRAASEALWKAIR